MDSWIRDRRIRALKFQPEAAALARLGLDSNFAAHALGGFADESQTDAGAFTAFVELLEHIEDAFLVFFRNPDAVIFKPEADEVAACFRPDTHVRDFPGLDEFDRIAQ